MRLAGFEPSFFGSLCLCILPFRNHPNPNVEIRAAPNIRFVFASGPNSGSNSYLVFGRIVAIGPNTNSDFCICGGHSEWLCWTISTFTSVSFFLV